MSAESNKEMAARFFLERWNRGNVSVYDELRAPWPRMEDERAWVLRSLAACSRFELTIVNMIAEGDDVAVHFRTTAVFKEDHFGLISAGEELSSAGVALVRFEDGRIAEDRAYLDDPRMLEFFQRI